MSDGPSDRYPPNQMRNESPYFLGKPRSKRPAFQLKKSTDVQESGSFVDEIVIEDDDSDKDSETKRSKFSKTVDQCNGTAFDFSDDPKVAKISKTIMSTLVDPEGKRGNPNGLNRLNAVVAHGFGMVNGKKEKKSKPWERKGLASMSDFKMASGGPVVRDLKQVVPGENSDDSSDGHSGNRKVLGNKRTGQFNPPIPSNSMSGSHLIKNGLAAMGMSTDGSNKEDVSGLRAEPSLKHFDANIISLIESEIMSITSETGWSDVAGLSGAKKALREIVVLPFKRPDVFKGIRAPPKGVLLFGPPGTGKTMIGRCVASQCNATFFNISASSLTSKWVGEGEKLVRALFAVARLKLPSVIFIDEIDSLLSARSESEHESSRRIKTEFLVQLDGVATNSEERLLVLGATNRPQELDEAARRRFAKRLYIALPEVDARLSIVSNLLRGMTHSVQEEDLSQVADLTSGYSGADMRQLCAEASMGPIRDIDNNSSLNIETIETTEIRPINITDFVEATRVVRPTVVPEDLESYQKWDKQFGCLL